METSAVCLFSSEGSELSDPDCIFRVLRSAESGNGALFETNSKGFCALFRVVKYRLDQAGVNHHSVPFSMKQFAADYAVVDTVDVVVIDAVDYEAKYAVDDAVNDAAGYVVDDNNVDDTVNDDVNDKVHVNDNVNDTFIGQRGQQQGQR